MSILVTGGLGYIGSNTVAELLRSTNETVIVLDNLANSSEERFAQIASDVGFDHLGGRMTFIYGDVRDRDVYRQAAYGLDQVESIIHFAGLKSVDKSFEDPNAYYSVNVQGTAELLSFAQTLCGLESIVFSSSATVYGDSSEPPLIEESPLCAASPYGYSKIVCESLLRNFSEDEPQTRVVALRYFNPVGASAAGYLGDDLSADPPASLFPMIATHGHKGEDFVIYGDDYPTRDGTCVRDFISVGDLACAHVAALRSRDMEGFQAVNVGSGVGYSVRDVLDTFGRYMPVRRSVGPRRDGDIAVSYADTSKATSCMAWNAVDTLNDMVQSEIRFWNSRKSRS